MPADPTCIVKPPPCFWTNDKEFDDFWNHAPTPIRQCMCTRCFDYTNNTEMGPDSILSGENELELLIPLVETWAKEIGLTSISNAGHGSALANEFETWVRCNYLWVYRAVGYDRGVFNWVLMNYNMNK